MSATLQDGVERRGTILTPLVTRSLLLLALAVGAAAGISLGLRDGAMTTDADLVRLLRAMAMLKLLFVAAATAAVVWRLQRPVTPALLAAYAVTIASMAAGPGLIWFLAYIGTASILLHGGMVACLVLLWRDRTVGALLEHAVARRRSSLRAR